MRGNSASGWTLFPYTGQMPPKRPHVAVAIAAALALVAVLIAATAGAQGAPAESPFVWRGVIQGQYGPQFSAAERRRLLRFEGRHGFNAYVHAPKDDPYQRTLWRDPYPPDQQAELDAEVALAAKRGIEWIPNVSPATPAFASPGEAAPPGVTGSAPICFSSDADLRQLLVKLAPFETAGSRTFMVSFDDVQRSFACPADSEAYGSGDAAFGRANADLLDRLLARLRDRDPGARLLTVASDYQGTADTDYLRGLRDHLGAGIEVMWTGPGTESRPFSPTEADQYAQLVGRVPVVWENWTTNDALGPDPEHPARIFLGPYARRAAIAGHVGGFFFNPANQSDLNYLPLATAGDWMRDPAHYRPRRAFLRETRRFAGRQAPALRAFAEANYSSSLRGSVEAPTLERLIRRFLRAPAGKARPVRAHRAAAVAHLRHGLRLAAHARGRLLRIRALHPFVRQARPFLRSVRLNARAGLVATDLLEATHRSKQRHLRRHLHRALRRAARWPAESFGTRSGVYGLTRNVIDRYVARVRERDRRR